jgi:hypothetical protein
MPIIPLFRRSNIYRYIFSICIKMNRKKRVRFHFARDIWIIPNTEDIIEAGIKEDLWWSTKESEEIKKFAFREFTKTHMFNQDKNKRTLFKTMWYELDFDAIYEMLETYKLTNKIELKKLYELYTIDHETNSKIL